MRYFLEYMQHNTDDSPLYVFDSRFEEDRDAKCLLGDFKVPSYFPEDLFELVGEKKRPPYRWFLVGPARSGKLIGGALDVHDDFVCGSRDLRSH